TAVVLGVDRNHRMARPIGRAEAGRKARNAAFDREAGLFKEAGHQARSLDLLHAEFAEIEGAVAEQSNGARIAIDVVEQKRLLGREISAAGHDRAPCASYFFFGIDDVICSVDTSL